MADQEELDVHVIQVRITVQCSDHEAEQLEALVEERVRALAKEIEKRFGPTK